MLSVYSNAQTLLNSNNAVEVSRLDAVDSALLDSNKFGITFNTNQTKTPALEIHAYSNDGVYLTGNHNAELTYDSNDTTSQLVAPLHLSIDLNSELSKIGINRGSYKILYNLFDNVLGSYDTEKLIIKEISPTRQELRLQLSNLSSNSLSTQWADFKARWEGISTSVEFAGIAFQDPYFNSFVLNFGFNETYQIVNFWFDNNSKSDVYIKLYNPLPEQYVEKDQLWISEEIITPVIDTILVTPKYVAEISNTLAGANFNLAEYEGHSVATDYKSWNDLLSSNLQTSQQLIDSQLSGSLGIKLNINYQLFDNFVHFGSAVERVKNFKYKLELIEYYSNKINTLAQVNGGDITQTNLADAFLKRNQIVSGFDDFEKYLFFESTSSTLYTHFNTTSGSLTLSPVSPWPKTTPVSLKWSEAYMLWSTAASLWSVGASVDSYGYFAIQELTTSGTAETYYNNLLEVATYYDRFNIHKLQNTVPLHIQELDDSEDLLLFVHMLGQHFDILWSYINALITINQREEHPKDGMPDDLLYHVAASMGFKLLNGRSSSELWKYSLGTDTNGKALQENNDGRTTIPDQNNTKEIWRRIVNNLPYILKSKGTSRSIKALLTCFGIPTTVLTIKEYGGPTTFTDNDHYPEYIHDVFHYAWLSTTGSLYIPTKTYLNSDKVYVSPSALEFRFKTDNNFTYGVGNEYTVFSTSGSSLTLRKETSTDNEGTLTYQINGVSGSISNLEIFDNSWHQVVIENLNGSGSLKVGKSLYGKSIYVQSASFATSSLSYTLIEDLYFATGSSKLYGHFQEIRLWSGSLSTETIQEHAASPTTYTYNVNRAAITNGSEAGEPYNRLLQRFTLSNDVVLSGSFYQPSVHPNQTINTGSVYFINYTNSSSIYFEPFEETYYTPSPSLGASSLFSNKVRIESSSLQTNTRLNTKTRVERSSLDRYSLDSNRVGVYFSPQTAINEDIFNQLGYFEIDDYIGDYNDLYNDSFTSLTNFANTYWKKYDSKNDFAAYFRALQIYDFTIFKYIKQLLPARVDPITGVVVEPTVLERSKVRASKKPIVENLTHEAEIVVTNTTIMESELDDYDALINVNTGNIDKLGTKWMQHRYVSKYKLTESGSYTPVQTVILNSRPSSYLLTVDNYYYSNSLSASLHLAYSSSLKPADINTSYGKGYENLKWNGSKLSAAGVNQNSTQTVDGGPVVKVTAVNAKFVRISSGNSVRIDPSTVKQSNIADRAQ